MRGIPLITRESFCSCLQIKALHLYDCLRANKATSAWGLEVRVPFLDKEFIDVAMAIDPEWKMVEKQTSLNLLSTTTLLVSHIIF